LAVCFELRRRCLGRLFELQAFRCFHNANFRSATICHSLAGIQMKFHMSKSLRFWVDVEYERIKNHASGHTRIELIAKIVRKFEQAGDAMRFLNADGRLAWKATPEMLSRLADAEQEARDDELGEW
jgi:hypothetical protein